jgi:cysteine desulfurase
MDSIYLDHNSTTPTRPEVIEAMTRCYAEVRGNPASQHRFGQEARRILEDSRDKVADILGADLSPPLRDRLIFTSGGTEANNLAILGIAASARGSRGTEEVVDKTPSIRRDSFRQPPPSPSVVLGGGPPGQIIISACEHQSVIEPAEHLLEQGWRLDTLGLTPDGVVRVEQLPPLLAVELSGASRLVSVMLGNHETGVLQPVAELAAICNRAGVPLHTDAVQVAGKLPVHFRSLDVAAMTIAAHKFQGPLGIGALMVRQNVPLSPLLFGGHQQAGLRPGTESVALAVGMATALELWQAEQAEHARKLRAMRDRFEQGLKVGIPNIIIHGATAERLPQTSSVAFPGIDGQVLLMALDLAGVACSVGAACSSGSTELSPTLRAMDISSDLVASSLRFSFGATTTEQEIDEALRRIVQVCQTIK